MRTLGVPLNRAAELLSRQDAEAAIQTAAAAPEGMFVLLAVINDANAIATRFGPQVEERVLRRSVEHFRAHMPGCEQFYRWRSDVLIAILHRAERIDEIRAGTRHFANGNLEEALEMGAHTMLIPITWSWSVIPVAPSAEATLAKIETLSAPPGTAAVWPTQHENPPTLFSSFARKLAPALARARASRWPLHHGRVRS